MSKSNGHLAQRITEDNLDNLFGEQGVSLGLIDPFAGLGSTESIAPQETGGNLEVMECLAHVNCRLANLEEAVARLVEQRPSFDGLSAQNLDDNCQPVFDTTPEPTNMQINAIMKRLDGDFPNLDRRRMQSQVKKWFRKRRERVGGRIITAFSRLYGEEAKSQKQAFLKELDDSETICDNIIKGAGINFTNHGAKIQFCRDKIKLHLSANKKAY
ncbi:hypothetical protein PSACC_00108 [Paramicrosporidium saccamoebae]|uniref:Uncharacterized protein n=1 Tax=Paramicrosporidium saccamoebae TaxID=1246581 RepID=A0A2H9TQP7_9FUNG|nr:hypothetical protein PSACC_00108 [Paramicrosporidium saccamoebae]